MPSGPPPPPDVWVRTDDGDAARRSRPGRPAVPPAPARAAGGAATELPADVATEIRRAADTATPHRKDVLVARMADAVTAYDRHRFPEALRLAKQLSHELPMVAAVRRLAGFSAYRLGRWREALGHLDAYLELSGELDAVPAVMDCLRALGRSAAVAQRWADLRHQSPDADVLTEARIVAAGSLADRGDLRGAIELLSAGGASRSLRNPSERHVRQWYALGDLYERAGDVPRARDLFQRAARPDPEAYDLPERLAALGSERSLRRPARARRAARPSAGAAPSLPGAGPSAAPQASSEDRGGETRAAPDDDG